MWNQSIFPCLLLTVASWPAYRFLRRQVRWSGIPISFRIFHCLLEFSTVLRRIFHSSQIKSWDSRRGMHLFNKTTLMNSLGSGKMVLWLLIREGLGCSNYCTIALISHASKIMLKILQVKFQHMWTKPFQIFKLNFENGVEPEIKLPTSTGL